MCGIVGIVRTTGLAPPDPATLSRMMDTLQHRGPDGQGACLTPHAAFGHRRLAIVAPAGNRQPFVSPDGAIVAVFNGEIYNFRELRADLRGRGRAVASDGDGEVIVPLYEELGDRFIDRLEGMFALALWDTRRRRLLLFRDRLGVKPLYYREAAGSLFFASELKALIAAGLGGPADPRAVADFLAFGFVPSPRSIFAGVSKLAPGERITWDVSPDVHPSAPRLCRETWWRPSVAARADGTADQLTRELAYRLETATRARLVADVPVGALLSAGIDSAAVAAALADASAATLHTFTVGLDDAGCDERADARQTARALAARHRELALPADLSDLLDDLTWHLDEPLAEASALPLLCLARFARPDAKVLLSGDGGDEILAGYRRYRFDLAEHRVRALVPPALRRAVFAPLARLAPASPRLPRFLRAAATLDNLAGSGDEGHIRSIARLRPAALARLAADELRPLLDDYDPYARPRALFDEADAPDFLARCQIFDIRFGLADAILQKVDRASMAAGLEVRSPMLDPRFVDFALSIPPRLRIRVGRGKFLLRRAVAARLGKSVAARRKRGFEVPLDAWFRGPLRNAFADAVLAPDARTRRWLDSREIRRIWHDHLAGRAAAGPVLWQILTLERWARRFLPSSQSTHQSRDDLASLVRLPAPSNSVLHSSFCIQYSNAASHAAPAVDLRPPAPCTTPSSVT